MLEASSAQDDKFFREIHEYIDRMPSLSTTVTKVLEVCNKPNTSPNDLNKVISLDPVLTGQVLKLINSAYYSLPNKITTLTRAIIMLGINTVKNLALSTAILGNLQDSASSSSLSMDDFWAHSISTGVTAKALARLKGVSILMLEEYFVAGLLHDLGKIPLSSRFPEVYQQALDLAQLEQGALARSELLVFGFDHSEVGRIIAEKWQLSPTLIETLSSHHRPEEAGEFAEMSYLVALANLYSNVYDFGSAGDTYVDQHEVKHYLGLAGLTWGGLVKMGTNIQMEIEKAQVFLQVSQGKI